MKSLMLNFLKLILPLLCTNFAIQAQSVKGFRFMEDGKPTAAEPFFRKDLTNPKTIPLALFGLSQVFLHPNHPANDIDSAYTYIVACQDTYKTLASDRKRKMANDLNANIINIQRRKVVSAAAARAQRVGTIMAYNDFLTRFSPLNSKTKQTAISARNTLVLQSAERSNSPQEGIALLDTYQTSFSQNTPDLKSQAEKLTFLLFMKQNSLEAFPDFQRQYPDNPAARDSSFYTLRWALQQSGVGALEKFVVQQPESVFRTIAIDSLAVRLLSSGSISELTRFISQNPKLPITPALSNRLKDLKYHSDPTAEMSDLQPFSPAVNTAGDDYAPILSADGQMLFLCRNTPGREDIFFSELDSSGEWTSPLPVDEWNTPYSSEAPESISADGNQFFLFRSGKFFQSRRTAEGWTAPEELPAPFNRFSWQADLSIAADGKAMLFAAKDFQGDINIYVSLLQSNNIWSTPFPLGPDINTTKADRSPFLHPDGVTLYFSSYGRGGEGGADVFMAKRLDETWTRWSEPENLGRPINTPGTDWGFRVSTDGQFAYYTATIDGQQDIMRYRLPEAFKPEQVGTISGTMTDASGNPLDVEIVWEDLQTGEAVQVTRTDPVTGAFFAVLPQRTQYGYSIRKPGYFPLSGNVDLSTELGAIQLEKPIELITVEEMRTSKVAIPLNNLFFETASFSIKPESLPELDRLADFIKNENLRIQIMGHTDNVGAVEANLLLSENRALAVREYLIQKGCSSTSINARGFGESQPRSSNETPEGRADNRRVEFRIE